VARKIDNHVLYPRLRMIFYETLGYTIVKHLKRIRDENTLAGQGIRNRSSCGDL